LTLGLTHASIFFEKMLRRAMDGRVKPGHDAESAQRLVEEDKNGEL
jgi:hypothetical protein